MVQQLRFFQSQLCPFFQQYLLQSFVVLYEGFEPMRMLERQGPPYQNFLALQAD